MATHRILALLTACAAALAACADQPAAPAKEPQPKPGGPVPLGVYEVTITGADGSGTFSASRALAMPSGPGLAMSPVASGLSIEALSTTTFAEGTRSQGGQRFIMGTFRVRNMTGAPLTNLTLIPVTRANSISGTPFSSLLLFNGSPAPSAIASQIIPSGAVNLGEDGRIRSSYADVLQAYEEAEVAAITPPADVTGIFPYGFVVRHASTPTTRTIPSTADPNTWDGLVTFAFRYPMQSTASGDPFSIGLQFMAVQDTETRMTESIEEQQDTAAVRRLRERATALGATTVTVLAGSPAASPFVTDYPGQRQICSVRTAGAAGSPVTTNTFPGFYSRLSLYRPGETLDACAANFTAGTASFANFGMAYPVTVRAMDRYGNVMASQVDTVKLTSSDGTATMPAAAALAGGTATLTSSYTTYGGSTLRATGRRLSGFTPVTTWGMTRQWTGSVDTDWFTHGDWAQNHYPGTQDSVVIPGDRPNYPLLVQNTTTGGMTMTDGVSVQPSVNLSSFDLTINGSLAMGNNGAFLGTGRVILTGTAATIGGGTTNVNMRNLRVTGTYTATSNVNVTGGRLVVQGGRLRTTGNRIRVRP